MAKMKIDIQRAARAETRTERYTKRAALVEARAEDYVHRAKRVVLELFGLEASHEQSMVTMQLATAMIHLDAADTIAKAFGTTDNNTDVKGA